MSKYILDVLGPVVDVLQLDLHVVGHEALQNDTMVDTLELGCEDSSHLQLSDVLDHVAVTHGGLVEVVQILHQRLKGDVVVLTEYLEPELLRAIQVGHDYRENCPFLRKRKNHLQRVEETGPRNSPKFPSY